MSSTIQIKRGTGSAVPSSLADGELAINLDNGKLYFGSGSEVINSFTFQNLTETGRQSVFLLNISCCRQLTIIELVSKNRSAMDKLVENLNSLIS